MASVLLLGRLVIRQCGGAEALEVCRMKALEVPGHCVQLIRLELPAALPDEISHWYVMPIRVTGQEPVHQILDIGKVSAPSLTGSLMPLGNLLKSEAGTL